MWPLVVLRHGESCSGPCGNGDFTGFIRVRIREYNQQATGMRPELPVLIKARAKIADPANWGQGIRTLCGSHRTLETCCAAEAIEDVTPVAANLLGPRANAFRALRAVIGEREIAKWNDAPERTHGEVLAAFDQAIANAS